ncbi:MAG: winged helix-turn-helix domain-containing protein [Acidobacteriota bacterium]|nr:winged helix-turn-helix domain-containing protein [Acidobacteriota bacterium]
MNELDPKIYKFGPFHIDMEQRVLFRGGVAISLTQKAFGTLAILVERQGKVVDKSELMRLVWPGTFVEENNLTQNISALRKVLGDSEYIETIPRRGYRFIITADGPTPAVRLPADSEPIPYGIREVVPNDPDFRVGSRYDSVSLPKRRRPVALAGTLTIVIAIVIGSLWLGLRFRKPQLEPAVVRSSITPPEQAIFTSPVAISPDGRQLAFGASTTGGKDQLWVRPLNALTSEPLAGTEGGTHPFWSPDSRFLGFFADGKLKRIDASGGPSLTLCSAPSGQGGTWNQDGTIVFAPADRETPLHQISASGGVSSPITALDRNRAETTHRWPWFLPDGRHFLYLAGNTASGGAIRVASIDSNGSDSRVLVESMFNAVYADGHLLFLREGALMAQPFDTKHLVMTSSAVPVTGQIQTPLGLLRGVFSVSTTGFMVYGVGGPIAGEQLVWFDRLGKQLARLGDPGFFGAVHLSPDGKSASVSMLDPATRNKDVWIYDVASGFRTKFTHTPAEERESAWSPDSRAIVFMSNPLGHFDLFAKRLGGGGGEELLLASDVDKYPSSFSPDGKFLLYWTQGDRNKQPHVDHKSGTDLWVLPLTGERKPFPFDRTTFNEDFGAFAPNGRWIAYGSDESERSEIYIAAFPGPGDRWRISSAGGIQPKWRRDGKELFYIATDKRLMAAEVNVEGDVPEVGASRALFGPLVCGGSCYDVSADGQRFLVRTEPDRTTAGSLTLVQNWTAALKR